LVTVCQHWQQCGLIVNDADVRGRSGITAAAATTLIADVKTLTPKPIKYVVDSHYHYDHAFGNQVFGPDVTIIGHDTTWRRLNGPGSLKERTYLTNSTAAIATRFTTLKRQISEATDPQQRAILQRQLAIHQHADEQAKIRPTPPMRRCRA
jgi:glyoxylase-like metal-dependent hydrolase (beta-lactamase superfamily II)